MDGAYPSGFEAARRTSNGWAAAAVVRRAYANARAGWRAAEPTDWRRWLWTVVLGPMGLLAFSAGLVWVGKQLEGSGALGWETEFIRWFASKVGLRMAIWAEIPGNSIVAVPILILAAGWAAWHYRPLRALTLLAAVPLYKGSVAFAWYLWTRPRPSVLDGTIAKLWQGWSSYPSGHVVQAVVVYGMLTYFWMHASRSLAERALAGLILLAIVTGSAVGRLRTGAHWPSDLIAGVILGAVWLGWAILAIRTADSAERPAGNASESSVSPER